jgi:hypothetical protein
VEDTLAASGAFALPGKKALKRKSASIEYIVVDVTESPINRSPKNKKRGIRAKKGHTIKTQVIINRKTKEIIDVREDKGSVHNFKVFKHTIGTKIDQSIGVDADLGYLGIEKLHPNSRTPAP